MSTCSRCQGYGTIKVPASDSTADAPTWMKVECPVCLGLGAYETQPRKPRIYDSIVLHSPRDPYEVIDLLPRRDNDE